MTTTTYFTYDKSHRLTSQKVGTAGEEHIYLWNQRNQLTKIFDVGGPDIDRTFAYNGLGERVLTNDDVGSLGNSNLFAYWSYDGRRLLQDNECQDIGPPPIFVATNYRSHRTPNDCPFGWVDEVTTELADTPTLDGSGSVQRVFGDSFIYDWFGRTILGSTDKRLRAFTPRGGIQAHTAQEVEWLPGGGFSLMSAATDFCGIGACGPGESLTQRDRLSTIQTLLAGGGLGCCGAESGTRLRGGQSILCQMDDDDGPRPKMRAGAACIPEDIEISNGTPGVVPNAVQPFGQLGPIGRSYFFEIRFMLASTTTDDRACEYRQGVKARYFYQDGHRTRCGSGKGTNAMDPAEHGCGRTAAEDREGYEDDWVAMPPEGVPRAPAFPKGEIAFLRVPNTMFAVLDFPTAAPGVDITDLENKRIIPADRVVATSLLFVASVKGTNGDILRRYFNLTFVEGGYFGYGFRGGPDYWKLNVGGLFKGSVPDDYVESPVPSRYDYPSGPAWSLPIRD